MVDGRASWRKIASVLGASERTVTRRGMGLLSSRTVEVHAMADPHRTGRGDPYLVTYSCSPSQAWTASAAVARRDETVTTYLLSGPAQGLADMWCPEGREPQLFLQELGAVPGVVQLSVSPVLRYLQTISTWNPGVLTDDEISQLRIGDSDQPWPQFTDPVQLDRTDRLLVQELREDGRRTFEELGRLCGVSEQTAARRVDSMRRSSLLTFRAVLKPRFIGLPVAALLRLRVPPRRIDEVAAELSRSHQVRYAAQVMGEYQVVADVRLPSKDALRSLLSGSWLDAADAIDSSLILEVLKQSDMLVPALR